MLGALLIVGLSAVVAAGFPIFEYPPPSGPYGVGTSRLTFPDGHVVLDNSRTRKPMPSGEA